MRTLLLGYTEKVIALEAQNAAMAPKVEAFERIAESEGSLCVTDAAKTLQIGPKAFVQIPPLQRLDLYAHRHHPRGRLSIEARRWAS